MTPHHGRLICERVAPDVNVVPRSLGVGLRLCERGAEDSRRLFLQVWRNVTVDVCRDRVRAVTETLLHDLHWRAKSEEHTRVGMAQVVWPDARQSSIPQRAKQRSAHLVREEPAHLVSKHEIGRLPQVASLQAHLVLPGLMHTQDVHQVGVIDTGRRARCDFTVRIT